MSYFPSILSDPQLAISKRERTRILGAASSAWFKVHAHLALYIFVTVVWIALMTVGTMLLEDVGRHSMMYSVLLWVVLLPIYLFGLHYLIFHYGFRPLLYRELHSRGYDVCLGCGYVLVDIPLSDPGSGSSKCPECATLRSALPERTEPDAD